MECPYNTPNFSSFLLPGNSRNILSIYFIAYIRLFFYFTLKGTRHVVSPTYETPERTQEYGGVSRSLELRLDPLKVYKLFLHGPFEGRCVRDLLNDLKFPLPGTKIPTCFHTDVATDMTFKD